MHAELEEAARIERERIEREKTELLEAKDQERRGMELMELSELEESFLMASRWKTKCRALTKWEHYICCDGSPDPTILQEINTFMSLWQEDTNNDIKIVIDKGKRVLQLISKLDMSILDTPFDELSSDDMIQYQNTTLELQNLLHHKYNQATEHLLKQASSYAESESGNMEVVIKEKDITLCIWANLKKNPRFRSQSFFDEEQKPCNGFELPKPLAICDVAVRILHTHYDHMSPFRTFPNNPPLLDLPVESILDKKEEEQSLEKENLVNKPDSILDNVLLKTLTLSDVLTLSRRKSSSRSRSSEDRFSKGSLLFQSVSRAQISWLQLFDIKELEPMEDFHVDLNQFMPIGGVYHFDLLKLPPQRKQVKGWTMVEVLDTGLETYPYTAVYEETEDNSAVSVGLTIHLLDSVIFFEQPLIARWDPTEKGWRTDKIGDVVYNMKEKVISFRMTNFFTITLMQDSHMNMPYQSWDLQPMGPDHTNFTILTPFAEVEIHIKGNQCMLNSMATVEDSNLLLDLRGIWMSPMALMVALKKTGLNIFPAEYSSQYVKMNKKKLISELMAYEQMALIATSFAFGWSKWNLKSGEENIVFKACEHLSSDAVKEKSWVLYMFCEQRAQRLAITEQSNAFSKNIADNSEFHSTLYHLIKDTASEDAIERVKQCNCLFIDAVHQLLLSTRVLTYS